MVVGIWIVDLDCVIGYGVGVGVVVEGEEEVFVGCECGVGWMEIGGLVGEWFLCGIGVVVVEEVVFR